MSLQDARRLNDIERKFYNKLKHADEVLGEVNLAIIQRKLDK